MAWSGLDELNCDRCFLRRRIAAVLVGRERIADELIDAGLQRAAQLGGVEPVDLALVEARGCQPALIQLNNALAAELQKFLDAPLTTLAKNVQQLLTKGLVTLGSAEKYRLTEMGMREGGRRFADEFDGLLQQGHYECNDPDCDCHSADNYAPCRATGHSHEHSHPH